MSYFVYQIFNTINGKIYIGKTNKLRIRFGHHQRVAEGGKEKYKNAYQAIHAALAKYGDAMEFICMQEFKKEEEAFKAEIYWIKYYNSNISQFGYNLTLGGEGSSGYKLTSEHKAKLLSVNIGKIVSPSTKLKISKSLFNLNMSGEKNNYASITNEEAKKIRELYATGEYIQKQLGTMFNIDQTTVSLIVNNKHYGK